MQIGDNIAKNVNDALNDSKPAAQRLDLILKMPFSWIQKQLPEGSSELNTIAMLKATQKDKSQIDKAALEYCKRIPEISPKKVGLR